MVFKNLNEFNAAYQSLADRYEQHFNEPLTRRNVDWFDPRDMTLAEANEGYELMKADVEEAISSNQKIEPIPDEFWDQMIF